jgi:hypothetical protein
VGFGHGTVIGIGASFIGDSPVFDPPLIAPVVFTSEGDVLYWIG